MKTKVDENTPLPVLVEMLGGTMAANHPQPDPVTLWQSMTDAQKAGRTFCEFLNAQP